MYDWLLEEEIDMEAMIEAITSLNGLYENQEKLNQKLISLDNSLKNLKSGKKNLKAFFTLKSSTEEATAVESEKRNVEKNLNDLSSVIKIATYNMDSYIEYFKVEKLAGYYKNLKSFAELQKTNSTRINDLWNCVGEDKNIQKLLNK
jgi:hypothetical protein